MRMDLTLMMSQRLKEVLRHERCVGIIGGRPNHALYFLGYNQHHQLLALDPHTVFPAVTSTKTSDFPSNELLRQIHVDHAQTLDFSRLDPNMTIGFLFANSEEFQTFCRDTKELNDDLDTRGLYGLYHVADVLPSYSYQVDDDDEPDRPADPFCSPDEEDDDFVILK